MPSEEAEPTIEELKGYVMGLAGALAECHAHCGMLILELRTTQLSETQKAFINECSKALTKSQNEFFKTFGNWNEPGNN